MSALACVARFDGAPVVPGTVERMTAAMAHRGPDGISHWDGRGVSLGYCAFKSTPESLAERQPLANDDASVILAFDGRVDNRDELRRDLAARGAVLRDATDAELVLRAYETFGEDSPDRVIGDFAWVAWDARRQCVFAARDPAGRRHFYHHYANSRIAFASEIRGLLQLQSIPRRLNEAKLVDSLVNAFDRVDQVGTLYEGIERLPAGHAMRVTSGGVTTWRYWDPSGLAPLRFTSIEECAEAFRAELVRAVQCRLRTTGPIGAMLSGGLDSSSIVGIARREFASTPIKTFSLVREDRACCPEWRSVRTIVETGGLDATFIAPSVAREVWRRYVDGIPDEDESFRMNYGYTNRLVYEAAQREGCRVLLDGIDGDMLFYWFEDSVALRPDALRCLPGVIGAARRHGYGRPLRTLGLRLATAMTPAYVRARFRRAAYRRTMPSDARLLRAEVVEPVFARRWTSRPYSRPASDQEYHARVFTAGEQSYAHETYGQVAFAHGLEARSPFADRRLMEFAVRMPFEAKVCSGWYKRLLRMGSAADLPDEVRWRRDVTMHPGGEFRHRLVEEVSRGAPEVWNRHSVERNMEAWVDPHALRRAWSEHERTRDRFRGMDLLVLVVAARWLGSRFA